MVIVLSHWRISLHSVFSTLLYNHREDRNRVDVVDLDPYGTAAPFIDAAVQSISDGGEIELCTLKILLDNLHRSAVYHLH